MTIVIRLLDNNPKDEMIVSCNVTVGFLKYPSPLLIIDNLEISPTVYVFATEVTVYVFASSETLKIKPVPPVPELLIVASVFN